MTWHFSPAGILPAPSPTARRRWERRYRKHQFLKDISPTFSTESYFVPPGDITMRVYIIVNPLFLLPRRTVFQRAVRMLVLAANQRVKPPPLVRPNTPVWFYFARHVSIQCFKFPLNNISLFFPYRCVPHLQCDFQACPRGSLSWGPWSRNYLCLALPVS